MIKLIPYITIPERIPKNGGTRKAYRNALHVYLLSTKEHATKINPLDPNQMSKIPKKIFMIVTVLPQNVSNLTYGFKKPRHQTL